MRISTKGRYSLEALLYMALRPDSEYVSTRTIAEKTGISDGYLEQLFIPLRKAGIINGIQGRQGGYLPGRPIDQITVGDILRAVETTIEPVACVGSKTCPVESDCIPRHTWSELYAAILDCIDFLSLKDLVEAYHALDTAEYAI